MAAEPNARAGRVERARQSESRKLARRSFLRVSAFAGLSLFVGAVISTLWSWRWPKNASEYLVPASSGLIAGISILGVIVQVINNFVLK